MPLEDPSVLKEKNYKRLRHLIRATFVLGINITAPSKFKDSLRVLTAYLLLSALFTLYGHTEYILRNRHNISLMTESICTFLQISISFLKISYIAVVQRRFYKVLNKISTYELVNRLELLSKETPYNKELRKESIKILDQCWMYGALQFNFYMCACIMIVTFYFSMAMGTNVYHAVAGSANFTNLLPCSALFPFWEDKMHQFPQFYILLVLSSSGISIASTGALSFDGIFIYFALHGVALIKILKKAIPLTTSPKVPKELRLDYLRQCISHYERTYQYCAEVNDLYLHLSLAQFLLSLVILGVVMFQGTVGLETNYIEFLRMVFYISAAGYEVVIYCLNGHFIMSESEGIANAFYQCEWYNESKEFKKLIQMVVMRSNRSMVMRASWFSTMSLPTLISILRTSGSYFLLLRKLAF